MEEQANKALAQLLERAVKGVDQAVAFSQAQIPDVVEQLLMWHGVKSVISCVLAFMSLVFAYYMATRCWAVVKTESSKLIFQQRDGVMVGMPVVGSIGTFIFLFGFFVLIDLDWLQIMIAPKLYLLEYAARLVN